MQKQGGAVEKTTVQPWGSVQVPQGIHIIIYLWVLQELRPSPSWRMERCRWPSWLLSTKAWTLLTFAPILCWIFLCSSPFMNMHVPFPYNFPSFAVGDTLLWERSPAFSLLAASNNESFLLPIFGLVVSTGLTPTKRRIQFLGNNDFTGTALETIMRTAQLSQIKPQNSEK